MKKTIYECDMCSAQCDVYGLKTFTLVPKESEHRHICLTCLRNFSEAYNSLKDLNKIEKHIGHWEGEPDAT